MFVRTCETNSRIELDSLEIVNGLLVLTSDYPVRKDENSPTITERHPYVAYDVDGNQYHPYGQGWLSVGVIQEKRGEDTLNVGENAIIERGCLLIGSVSVGAGAIVMQGSTLGNGTVIEPGARVEPETRIGVTPPKRSMKARLRQRINSRTWRVNTADFGYGNRTPEI